MLTTTPSGMITLASSIRRMSCDVDRQHVLARRKLEQLPAGTMVYRLPAAAVAVGARDKLYG